MEKYRMIPEFWLEHIKKRMDNILEEGINDETVARLRYTSSELNGLLKEAPVVPLEHTPGISKGGVVKEMGLDRGIDFSLPQSLVDTIHTMLGVDICPHFVMDCRTNPYYLVPITEIGRWILPAIYSRVFNMEVPEYYYENGYLKK